MKILITGSKGFIGKNLVAELNNRKAGELLEFDKDNTLEELESYAAACDVVFHLAGINRPLNEKEFEEGNLDFTRTLLSYLKKHNNPAPIIFSSSIQSKLDNPYGRSKLAAENVLAGYSQETGIPVAIYRLPNVFGKWCRPSYNSVVATFCHNIAHDLPVQINDPETLLNQVYVDDVVKEFIFKSDNLRDSALNSANLCEKKNELIEDFTPVYRVKLGELATLISSFMDMRSTLEVPDLSDEFTGKLYATYLSYLPQDKFSYLLKMNIDDRGSFTEFIKTNDKGLVSINISKPGIVKGNHWHHTKNEKFLVVSGNGIIRFRKVGSTKVIEYPVNGENLEVVDIPTGYTHNIENLGTADMVTVMWASEPFDPEHPDTFFETV
jgi:UDP-2-acetamido-2,6-beta-L-arabino-hexul-4-ose reductase